MDSGTTTQPIGKNKTVLETTSRGLCFVPSFKKIRAVFLIVHFPLEKRVQKSYFLDLLSWKLEDSEFLHMNRNHDSEHIKTLFNQIGQGFRLEINI